MLIFRQLFDPQSSTYTYLLADPRSRDAVLIDPVFEQARREVALIEELGLDLKLTIETHIHADHVTGARRQPEQGKRRPQLWRGRGAAKPERSRPHRAARP